jgi:photosystem II stability/assembly factor-like uncharacterized protein
MNAQGQPAVAQPSLTPQISGTTSGLIAVSPVNPQVVWASGRFGTFVVTTDGGNTWRAGVVPGAETLQFRDVEGVSAKVAYLQSIGANPTDFRIYKTVDGGATWTMQFQNQNPGAFYDCFAFWTPNRGISHSDSVDGVFPDLRTTDGVNWQDISSNMRRPAGRRCVRRQRHVRSDAGRAERLDRDRCFHDRESAGDEGRRRHLGGLRHAALEFAERGRLYGGLPQSVEWHRGRR